MIRGARRHAAILAAARAGEPFDPEQVHLARIVEYDVPNRDGTSELIVLLTTITDPARADELAGAYPPALGERTRQRPAHDPPPWPGRVRSSWTARQ